MADLWNELFKMRDAQREQLKNARAVVHFKDIPWEINRQGKMKWYLHPAIKDTAHRALIVYVQEIPPGSRSGKLKHQGGNAFYVWRGKGYSTINDKKYEWEEEDVILLPVDMAKGIVFQHFNTDPKNPTFLVYVAPNVTDPLGVDLGIGLEQLEDCPEYTAAQKKK